MAATTSSKQRLRERYDWVVLGDHPGALLSGCLAAKMGCSVLILSLAPSMKRVQTEDGQVLDFEPNDLIGLSRGEGKIALLSECLNRLGVTGAELESHFSSDVDLQVVTPQARLVFASGGSASSLQPSEFRRELGAEKSRKLGLFEAFESFSPEIESFWESFLRRPEDYEGLAVPSKKTIKNRKGAKHESVRLWASPKGRASDLAEFLNTREIQEVFKALDYAIAGQVSEDPELEKMLHLLFLSRIRASFRGGLTAYREFLLSLAAKQGAHVPDEADCRRIFVDHGEFVGVQIANHGNMIGAESAVLGCPLEQALKRVVAGGGGMAQVEHAKKRVIPTGWKFSISLTIHAEGVPPGVTPKTIWQEPSAPPLEIEMIESPKNAKHRVILARTILPMVAESFEPDFQRLVAARIFKKLTEIFPFLEFHLVRMYPDFREDDLKAVYGGITLDQLPGNFLCYSGEGLGSETGIRKMYSASAESYPGLGSLGATVAGIKSLASFAKRLGVAAPLS